MTTQNSTSTKPVISRTAFEQLEFMLKTSHEEPNTSLGELQWNSCKRHIMDCVLNNLQVQA